MNQRWLPLVLIAVGAVDGGGAPGHAAPTLDTRLDELRAEGSYVAALERASGLDVSAPWRAREREMVTATLRVILSRPADERTRLAQADSLQLALATSAEAGALAADDPGLARELDLRRRVLGEDHPEVLRAELVRLSLSRAQGRPPELDQARSLTTAIRDAYGADHPLHADALDELGLAYQQRARFDQAEAVYADAVAIREAVPEDRAGLADTLDHLGGLLRERGRFEEAEQLLRRALALYRDLHGDGHPFSAIAQNNLAAVLQQQGNYAAAEPLLRACLARFRELFGETHMAVVGASSNLAELRKLQGDYAGAEEMYEEALRLAEEVLGPTHLHVGTVRHNFAGLRKLQHRSDEALELHAGALAIFEASLGPDHPQVATAKNNIGFLHLIRGEPKEAELRLREALVARERLLGAHHPETAGTRLNLGRALQNQGRTEEARSELVAALATQETALAASHPHLVNGLVRLARAEAILGDTAGARARLQEASVRYETARLRAGTGLERATFLEPPYDALAAAEVAAGRSDAAWAATERGRARVLLDLLSVSGRTPLSADEARRQTLLLARVDELESRRAVLARSDSTSRRAEVEAELVANEADLRDLQGSLEERHGVDAGRPATPAEVSAHLVPGACLLGWVDASEEDGAYDDWVYVLDGTGRVRWRRLPTGTAHRRREVASALRQGLAEAAVAAFGPSLDDGVQHLAGELYALSVAPAADLLAGSDHLVVVPSGALHGVPIEALVDADGEFVGTGRAVTYVPSASFLTRLDVDVHAGTGRPALLVGDPPFGPLPSDRGEDPTRVQGTPRSAVPIDRLPRLPRSRDEVLDVAALYPGSLLLVGDAASEPRLTGLAASDSLRSFGTLHLATHALVNHERPEGSALVLSQLGLPDPLTEALAGRPIVDGVITAGEVTRRWRLDADLVVLSACGTGLGARAFGEGFVGLAHAFFRAGARNLVVSLWEVDDVATARLMRRFHENRTGRYPDPRGVHPAGTPLPVATALAEAKSWLRSQEEAGGYRPYAHPAVWAAFVAMGPGR